MYDKLFEDIAAYVISSNKNKESSFYAAKLCLLDSIGCAILSSTDDKCKKVLGNFDNSSVLQNGIPVLGTNFKLNLLENVFNLGCLIRWLDFNDTWLAAEWGHPSDNIGSILPVGFYRSYYLKEPVTMQEILTNIIKAYEIQGMLALDNSFNKLGLDHVILVKLASSAVTTSLLGGSEFDIKNVLSQVFVDGSPLRVYRQSPNTNSRKSWAAADAVYRAVYLSLLTLKGEPGYPSAISSPTWGFSAVYNDNKELRIPNNFTTYVIDNILYKVLYPAEFHGQTAAEAAVTLYPEVKNRIDKIKKIQISTHESAMRIINKNGPLNNPADRDHCLQYIVALGLLHGNIKKEYYTDDFAKDPKIDFLRSRMEVTENLKFSSDYMNPDVRAFANSVQIIFDDDTVTDNITINYPLGHKNRRKESLPFLKKKFADSLSLIYSDKQQEVLLNVFDADLSDIMEMEIQDFYKLFSLSGSSF